MKQTTRRNFLKSSVTAGLALGMPGIVIGAQRSSRSPGPNDTVRVAVIGLGSTTAVGGLRGRWCIVSQGLPQTPHASGIFRRTQEHFDHCARRQVFA